MFDCNVEGIAEGTEDNYPRTLTEAEQKAWASNIGVSGIGLSEGESMLGLFGCRISWVIVSPCSTMLRKK